jgi:hypothetical protein
LNDARNFTTSCSEENLAERNGRNGRPQARRKVLHDRHNGVGDLLATVRVIPSFETIELKRERLPTFNRGVGAK